MATKVGVETLVEKTGRYDMKLIEYASIQAAIQKYNETTRDQTAQIFTTRTNDFNSRGRNHPRGNFNNRGGQRPPNYQNYQQGNRNQYQNSNSRNQNYRPNYHRGRGNSNNRYQQYGQQYGQQNRYQQFDQRNARMFIAQPMPQNPDQMSNFQNVIQPQQLTPQPIIQNQQHTSAHPLVHTLGQFTQ